MHTHSLCATAITTVREDLPAIHYQIVELGGTVPVRLHPAGHLLQKP